MNSHSAPLGTVAELAARIGATATGDTAVEILRIAAVGEADAQSLTFATDARYVRAALASRAAAVLIDESLAKDVVTDKPLILVPSARIALAQLLSSFLPPRPQGPQHHSSAVVDPTAEIGAGVILGANVVVGPRAKIGDNCILEAGVIIAADVVLGEGCWLRPRATMLEGCIAGKRVVLNSGAVIGGDGFGYVPVEGQLLKIPQIGIVELGDDVEIGVNTCVDRAQTGVTKIGAGTKLDNLIQIGHNVEIGRMTVIAAQTAVAGSAKIGDGVQIGGQSAINGHITVGSLTKIAGCTRVWQSVEPGKTMSGDPAQDHHLELRKKVHLKNLQKLVDRVNALERGNPS
jgi:UDP-3-O-[3-hydroxymyristoyl] glucosamine N-acyltransferase